MKSGIPVLFRILLGLSVLLGATAADVHSPHQGRYISNPQGAPVKLIFIHHSTGENWLRDDYGGLGKALAASNYFVSDTNYGWGPDAIGDRTDIPNWTEWFASSSTPDTMQALFDESGQNSFYTRSLPDPGGENVIVLFKSCFPNSALDGKPNDPPGTYEEFTVSGAKYVYNTILGYFATRPDKLFIVITAPPLSDASLAGNARAFNNWLVNDWLKENHYTLKNVAVFDFYNILTGTNAHHRLRGNEVEHIPGKRDTLAYPSGDDHPNERGSRKATDEFIPLLNYFYEQWQAGEPPSQPPEEQPTSKPVEQPVTQPGLPAGSGWIDDFEGQPPAETDGWESFFQDNADTRLDCRIDSSMVYAGFSSLKFGFDVDKNSWATCGFYYSDAQDWSVGQGVSFRLRSDKAGVPFDVNVDGGSPGARETHVYHTQTPPGSVDGWILVSIPWDRIVRAEWEEDAGSPIDPAQVTGFAIGLSTPENERRTGTIWLDDLGLIGVEGKITTQNQPAREGAPTEAEPDSPGSGDDSGNGGLQCFGATILPVGLIGFGLISRRRRVAG